MNNATAKMDKARDAGSQAIDKAKEAGNQAMDKAKEFGSQAYDTAKETGSEMFEKAKEAGKSAFTGAERAADAGASALGSGIRSVAGTIRDKGPHGGRLGDATSAASQALESGGRYLQQEGFTGLAGDLGEFVKKNPIPALLAGIGIGFLIARLTTRS